MLKSEIVESVQPAELTPGQVANEFRTLVASGLKIRAAGTARRKPLSLLARGYTPKYKLRLFDTTVFLTNLRYDDTFRFFVAYVMHGNSDLRASRRQVFPRIFYKDQSLVWRCGTHLIRTEEDIWIGKGDLKSVVKNGEELVYSAEETTDLPFEIQPALDVISRRGGQVRRDTQAVDLVLRRAPDDRLEPYADFVAPRRRACSDPRNLINRGRYVATFRRENDPTSLGFVAGFEPDFDRGVLEVDHSKSRMYGGAIRKFRILSANRRIQYLFIAAPNLVWIVPAQALTTELSSYAVRTVDVQADEDLFVPGYEYHFVDDFEDPPQLFSQIPEGFAGQASEIDSSRADASPWLEKLPIIREFRRKLLG